MSNVFGYITVNQGNKIISNPVTDTFMLPQQLGAKQTTNTTSTDVPTNATKTGSTTTK
ncbi:MAG: hypothetical protein WAM14_19670 [Candidatus Nitrosopolaris sp.]